MEALSSAREENAFLASVWSKICLLSIFSRLQGWALFSLFFKRLQFE